ncbi:hypothetical protein CSUI_004531 [Cystoisospora suis]|uniref:Uncharacterized protein n=1 Tax=Cystoisospora suis TaxID=483139 RepID=A0A2C6L0N8_9APIC|nr:hypothetical protein CSUI_004531 [Cystoisospora suis]
MMVVTTILTIVQAPLYGAENIIVQQGNFHLSEKVFLSFPFFLSLLPLSIRLFVLGP